MLEKIYQINIKTYFLRLLKSMGFLLENLIDKAKERPLYLRTNKDLSIVYGEKDKIIYYKFDDSIIHPTKKEVSMLKDMLKENKADKLIIDIRNNMGGI
jgi:hypothetical protein